MKIDFAFFLISLQVKTWVTMYDPFGVSYHGYGDGSFAPGVMQPETAPYAVAHRLIQAHTRVYDMYKTDFASQKGKYLPCVINYINIISVVFIPLSIACYFIVCLKNVLESISVTVSMSRSQSCQP